MSKHIVSIKLLLIMQLTIHGESTELVYIAYTEDKLREEVAICILYTLAQCSLARSYIT